MPRKPRTKPAEAPISSTAQTQPEPAPGGSIPAEAPAAQEPDILDQIIAARAAGQFETPAKPDKSARIQAAMDAAPVKPASELTEGAPPVRTFSSGRDPLPVRPNPFSIDRIGLEDSKNGTQMRLLRFRHTRGGGEDVWIQFDKNPGKDVTEAVKAAGFRWERDAMVGDHNGAWVMELIPGREVRMMLDAERLFRELGNRLRQANGLDPVGMAGVAAD